MKKNKLNKLLHKAYKSGEVEDNSDLLDNLNATIPFYFKTTKPKTASNIKYKIVFAGVFAFLISITFWKIDQNNLHKDRSDFTPTKVIYLSIDELDEDYFKPTKTIYLKESEAKIIR